jgi:hypothetical protein
MAERVDANDVKRRMDAGALLVCAYDDEAKCEKMRVQGAMTLGELRAQASELPRDQEILLYCA